MRTALYRFYGADDVLLYVGITDHLGTRWSNHARTKPWWADVQRQTAEWHETRAAAEEAERTAIRDEAPLWNINSSPWEAVQQVDGRYAATLKPKQRSARGIDSTPIRKTRIPEDIWDVFGSVTERLGTTRSASMLNRMRAVISEYGNAEELARLERAEQELAERRSRRGGRPRKEPPAAD